MMVNFNQYLKVKIDPAMPPDQINFEQDGKVVGSIVNLQVETPSIAALKANLYYAEAMKQAAHTAHANALTNYYLALDALNQAIVKKWKTVKNSHG
jgi:hypothetical protein